MTLLLAAAVVLASPGVAVAEDEEPPPLLELPGLPGLDPPEEPPEEPETPPEEPETPPEEPELPPWQFPPATTTTTTPPTTSPTEPGDSEPTPETDFGPTIEKSETAPPTPTAFGGSRGRRARGARNAFPVGPGTVVAELILPTIAPPVGEEEDPFTLIDARRDFATEREEQAFSILNDEAPGQDLPWWSLAVILFMALLLGLAIWPPWSMPLWWRDVTRPLRRLLRPARYRNS